MPDWTDPLLSALQWPAMVIALVGAWYVGHHHARGRFWGFWGFLVSNLLWVLWAVHDHAWGLLIMQGLFVITSVRGILQNRRPAAP
jgi:hypothetical protein